MMLSYERPTMGQPTPATSDHLPLSPTSSKRLSNGTSSTLTQPKSSHHHIWLITGPAGCGKSTVAQFIAKAMNLPFIEGDEVLASLQFSPASLLTEPSTTPKQTLTKWHTESPSQTPTAGTGSPVSEKSPSPAWKPAPKASFSPVPH